MKRNDETYSAAHAVLARARGREATTLAAMLAWLTFISATLAAGFQGRRAVQGWLYDQRDRKEARHAARAGWSAHGVNTWTVQLAEPEGQPDPFERSSTVTLTVCGQRGEPSPDQADRLRRYLETHTELSRNPPPDELASLAEAARVGGRLAIRRARRSRAVT
jgi:hypothetical protein